MWCERSEGVLFGLVWYLPASSSSWISITCFRLSACLSCCIWCEILQILIKLYQTSVTDNRPSVATTKFSNRNGTNQRVGGCNFLRMAYILERKKGNTKVISNSLKSFQKYMMFSPLWKEAACYRLHKQIKWWCWHTSPSICAATKEEINNKHQLAICEECVMAYFERYFGAENCFLKKKKNQQYIFQLWRQLLFSWRNQYMLLTMLHTKCAITPAALLPVITRLWKLIFVKY